MAIYQLFDHEKKERFTETFDAFDNNLEQKSKKSSLFSTLVTRFCFLLLLIADCAWLCYNIGVFILVGTLHLVTGFKLRFLQKMMSKFWLHFRRSLACGLSLFVGLFNPPFGIMVACTYFLMYDKAGMEEVVPVALQAQFKDIFQTEK